jgi:GntR family transcriptional regulator
MLLINPNTVAKAYQELERCKTIETVRGRGTFVTGSFTPKMDEEQARQLKDRLKKTIIEAHYLGLGKPDIISLVEDIYKELE